MIIIGADEAGRGPWAGPLVVAVCHIPKYTRLPGLNDSKKLSKKSREKLFKLIKSKTQYAIGIAQPREVEKGMIKALSAAYKRALKKLKITPNLLLIDGRDKLNLPYPYNSARKRSDPSTSIKNRFTQVKLKFLIRGDQKERCIMAASILAKVTRDEIMAKLAQSHPQYGFEKHKGYGTRQHRQNIAKHGTCKLHRKNFYIESFGKRLGEL